MDQTELYDLDGEDPKAPSTQPDRQGDANTINNTPH